MAVRGLLVLFCIIQAVATFAIDLNRDQPSMAASCLISSGMAGHQHGAVVHAGGRSYRLGRTLVRGAILSGYGPHLYPAVGLYRRACQPEDLWRSVIGSEWYTAGENRHFRQAALRGLEPGSRVAAFLVLAATLAIYNT